MTSTKVTVPTGQKNEFRDILFDLGIYIEKLDPLKRNLIQDAYRTLYVNNVFRTKNDF